MHADITRDTFRPSQHYVGIVMQQGRVQIDADANESDRIDLHRRRALGAATIGPIGVEKDTAGFDIQVAPDSADLLVGEGRLWIDGRLCENTPQPVGAQVDSATDLSLDSVVVDGRELLVGDWVELGDNNAVIGPLQIQDVNTAAASVTVSPAAVGVSVGDRIALRRITSLMSQPYRRDLVDLQSLPDGQYGVIFTSWDREVTDIDDPAIVETALNGAETATRLQSAWRIDVVQVDPGLSVASCDIEVPNFPPEHNGRVAVFLDAATAADNPCVLPDAGGYRGLEHQLYRVEVHRVIGDDIVFKWQRDNANLVSQVDAVGTTFRVDDIGRDEVSGFQEAGFVELTNERLMLANESGDLLKVGSIQRAVRQIEVNTAFAETHAETAVDRSADGPRPRARRWDGRTIASTTNPDQPLVIERGLVMRIEGTSFREGDYWIIPARTATIADPGMIEWPQTDAGAAIAVAPHGVDFAYGKVALVDLTNRLFVPDSEVDCRELFPSLTDIEATDVSFDPTICDFPESVTNVQEAIDELCGRAGGGTCSRTAVPGDGWESVFADLPAGASAEICFPIGTFSIDETVAVAGDGGHLLVHGAGWGSQIHALTSDSAIVFSGWESVTVRDLSVRAGNGGTRPTPNPNNGLRGALSFSDCEDTTIERVKVRTAPRTERATSALSVYGAGGSTTGTNRARISHCLLEVGDKQVGILGVDLGRLTVEDNVLTVIAANRTITSIGQLAASEQLAIQRLLFRNLEQVTAASVANVVTDPPGRGLQPGVAGRVPGSLSAIRRATNSRAAADVPGLAIGSANFRFATIPQAESFWAARLAGEAFDDVLSFKKFQDRSIKDVLNGSDTSDEGIALAAFLTQRVASRRIPVMSQGIVAGGSALGDVMIINNHVHDAIRGIHLGVSQQSSRADTHQVGDRFVVADNRVSVRIPTEGARGRHGIFCGNAGRITVRSNEVTFTSDAPDENVVSTGIRIFGFVDRFATVRENLVQGFENSVEMAMLMERGGNQSSRTRMYQVRENVLVQSGIAVRKEGPFSGDVIDVDNAGSP